MMRYAPLCSLYFKLLSVTSQVRKAQDYFNELQVKRSPFVDKSTILKKEKNLVKLKGKKRTILTKMSFPCFSAENKNSVFDSRFHNFLSVSVVANFQWLYTLSNN